MLTHDARRVRVRYARYAYSRLELLLVNEVLINNETSLYFILTFRIKIFRLMYAMFDFGILVTRIKQYQFPIKIRCRIICAQSKIPFYILSIYNDVLLLLSVDSRSVIEMSPLTKCIP